MFFHCFSEKIRLDVSSDSSAGQRIHMKNQALFSSKDKSKKLKCCLLQFLFGALRIKTFSPLTVIILKPEQTHLCGTVLTGMRDLVFCLFVCR